MGSIVYGVDGFNFRGKNFYGAELKVDEREQAFEILDALRGVGGERPWFHLGLDEGTARGYFEAWRESFE